MIYESIKNEIFTNLKANGLVVSDNSLKKYCKDFYKEVRNEGLEIDEFDEHLRYFIPAIVMEIQENMEKRYRLNDDFTLFNFDNNSSVEISKGETLQFVRLDIKEGDEINVYEYKGNEVWQYEYSIEDYLDELEVV